MRKTLADVAYLLSGLTGRTTPRKCPSCGGADAVLVSRKYLHRLYECTTCHLLYRYPSESADQMARYYQHNYNQPGLTTDLPDDAELVRLLETNFGGTSKSYADMVPILGALGLAPGANILEFGANWGYGVWQLNKAGYQTIGYEISRPRATFASKLGVNIVTNLADVSNSFDAVYSRHVLEHVGDPLATIRQQWDLVRPGGFVVAHTPNGSASRRLAKLDSFLPWNRVHPVLLSDQFIRHALCDARCLISSQADVDDIAQWLRGDEIVADCLGKELFFVVQKPDSRGA